jgi:Holliday junction resolvase
MRARRTDENQHEIIQALQQIGCAVADTSAAGEGFPDLVVGYHGKNYLIEVKDGNKSPSRQSLTASQIRFHGRWRGQIAIVKSVNEAIELVRYENTKNI